MSGHMRKHHIKTNANFVWHGDKYSIPLKLIEKYKVSSAANDGFDSIENVFSDLISEAGEPAVLLKGLRAKEDLSQVDFAEVVGITQQNLSAMENGRRSIGKNVAKRIAEKFGIDYRLFL